MLFNELCRPLYPRSVDIKGFCTYKEHPSKGIEWHQAEDFVARLSAHLPESIKPRVGDIRMYGLKNHKFTVKVAPPAAVEVALIWKDVCRDNEGLHFNGLTQFATPEREPTEAYIALCRSG